MSNTNFLQLGRRSDGRPQRTVYPRRLPVSCDHYVSRHRTHNLPIVSRTRYRLGYRDHYILLLFAPTTPRYVQRPRWLPARRRSPILILTETNVLPLSYATVRNAHCAALAIGGRINCCISPSVCLNLPKPIMHNPQSWAMSCIADVHEVLEATGNSSVSGW